MPIYRREGNDPHTSWNEVIRRINGLIDECSGKDVEPLPVVAANHILSTSDIETIHSKLVELCSDSEFDEVPALWRKSTIDDIIAAIDAGICGDCEEEDCEECEDEDRDHFGEGVAISWPVNGQSPWKILDWAQTTIGMAVHPKFTRWEVYIAMNMTLVASGPVVKTLSIPEQPPSEENPDGVPAEFVGIITLEEDPPQFPYQALSDPIFEEGTGNVGFLYRIVNANGDVILDGIEVMFFQPAPPVPGPAKLGSALSGPVSLPYTFPPPVPNDFILRLKCECLEDEA